MRCPRCAGAALVEKEREGITVDVCPECRGIWLDRGELERLQARTLQEFEQATGARERGAGADATPRPMRRDDGPVARDHERGFDRGYPRDDDDDDDDRRRARGDGRGAGPGHPPRKRRWFEMFDLFD